MDLDAKQKLLVAIYTEYQKDMPNMASITADKLGLTYETFKVAADKLDNERLVNGIKILRGGDGSIPVDSNIHFAKMSPYGIDYVETKLGIEKTLTAKEKVEKVAEETAKWGFDQLKDIAAKVLAEIATKSI